MIQERIIEYLEWRGISKYRFYKDTGLSNGFLDKGGSIGTDKCERIISVYPDINIEWLITGRGSMLTPNTRCKQATSTINDQESEQPDSPVKQRMREYIVSLGVDKEAFYRLSGFPHGALDGDAVLTESMIAKFLSIYPELNSDWLLTGNGYMLKPNKLSEQRQDLISIPWMAYDEDGKYSPLHRESEFNKDLFIAYLDKKDSIIRELSEQIGRLKAKLEE